MTVLYRKKTKWNDIRVEDEYPIRRLLFGYGLAQEQSAIDVTDLHKHVYDYSLLAMHSFLFVNEPINILCVGLGGGTMPRQTHFYFPQSNIDVIEIDPEIVNIAKKYFFFEENDKVKVHVGDAFNVVNKLDRKYDIVFLDAYTEDYIPYHLMSIEFTKLIYDLMPSTSVLVINTCYAHHSFNSQLNTLRNVFGDSLWRANGARNELSTAIFAVKGGLEPLNVNLSFCHFIALKPILAEVTNEIKKAKIFSLEKQ